jgi:predicted phage terminase large subunit-like protein
MNVEIPLMNQFRTSHEVVRSLLSRLMRAHPRRQDRLDMKFELRSAAEWAAALDLHETAATARERFERELKQGQAPVVDHLIGGQPEGIPIPLRIARMRYVKNIIQQIHQSQRPVAVAQLQEAACETPAQEEIGDLSLIEWGQKCLSDYFTRPPSAMHRWLAGQLSAMQQARGTKLNCVAPRGSAKSTLGTLAYPLRMALEGKEQYIWIVSDTAPQADALLDHLRQELESNEELAEEYPHAVGRGRIWRRNRLVLRNGVCIDALSTGQRVRGRRYRQYRPSLVICDDLQNDQQMESARTRGKSRQWFQSALLKAGNKQTNIVHLATALHRDALAMELERKPGWTSRTFAAIERWPDNMLLWDQWEAIYCDSQHGDGRQAARAFYEQHRDEMHAGAVLLWPEEEDLYTLMCMRAEGGRDAFAREKQSEPMSPGQCEWPASYFDERIWFDAWPDKLVKTIAIDPSKGSRDRPGDYSALVMLGIGVDDVLYVDAELGKYDASELVAAAAELYCSFRPHALGIEANQGQHLLAELLKQELVRQRVFFVEPELIDNRVNKRMRIRRLTPFLAARRIRFKRHSPGTQLLVHQLRDFPIGDHDDGPDALEMAVRMAEGLLCETPGDGLGDRLVVA